MDKKSYFYRYKSADIEEKEKVIYLGILITNKGRNQKKNCDGENYIGRAYT